MMEAARGARRGARLGDLEDRLWRRRSVVRRRGGGRCRRAQALRLFEEHLRASTLDWLVDARAARHRPPQAPPTSTTTEGRGGLRRGEGAGGRRVRRWIAHWRAAPAGGVALVRCPSELDAARARAARGRGGRWPARARSATRRRGPARHVGRGVGAAAGRDRRPVRRLPPSRRRRRLSRLALAAQADARRGLASALTARGGFGRRRRCRRGTARRPMRRRGGGGHRPWWRGMGGPGRGASGALGAADAV